MDSLALIEDYLSDNENVSTAVQKCTDQTE